MELGTRLACLLAGQLEALGFGIKFVLCCEPRITHVIRPDQESILSSSLSAAAPFGFRLEAMFADVVRPLGAAPPILEGSTGQVTQNERRWPSDLEMLAGCNRDQAQAVVACLQDTDHFLMACDHAFDLGFVFHTAFASEVPENEGRILDERKLGATNWCKHLRAYPVRAICARSK